MRKAGKERDSGKEGERERLSSKVWEEEAAPSGREAGQSTEEKSGLMY